MVKFQDLKVRVGFVCSLEVMAVAQGRLTIFVRFLSQQGTAQGHASQTEGRVDAKAPGVSCTDIQRSQVTRVDRRGCLSEVQITAEIFVSTLGLRRACYYSYSDICAGFAPVPVA